MIKTPARYDAEDCLLRDGNGHALASVCAWRYNFRNEGADKTRTPEDGHADGQAIADALNDHARLTAENAQLQAKVEAAQTAFVRICAVDGIYGKQLAMEWLDKYHPALATTANTEEEKDV